MIEPRSAPTLWAAARVSHLDDQLNILGPTGDCCALLLTSMPVASSYHCLTSSLLFISSLILLSYFFSQFPHAPQGYSVHPSLASLGPETKAKDVYPEDYYSGGAYVSLPFGNVRLSLWFPAAIPIPILCPRSVTGYLAPNLERR